MTTSQQFYVVALHLKNFNKLWEKKAHITLRALIKSIKPASQELPLNKSFRILGMNHINQVIQPKSAITVELTFFNTTLAHTQAWLKACGDYILQDPINANFWLVGTSIIQEKSLNQIIDLAAKHTECESAELCFITPLPFKPVAGRTEISSLIFFTQLQKRVISLFNLQLNLPDLSKFTMATGQWHFEQIDSKKKSDGSMEMFAGCCGSLYFSGNLKEVMPWLYLAHNIYACDKRELSFLGCCDLHMPARPQKGMLQSTC